MSGLAGSFEDKTQHCDQGPFRFFIPYQLLLVLNSVSGSAYNKFIIVLSHDVCGVGLIPIRGMWEAANQ